jgi:[ribosomal protein S18]-alanine N-acetyltransferase
VKIALRYYRPEDFEELYRIDQSCYSSDLAYSREELRRYLAFPGADCIVAQLSAGEIYTEKVEAKWDLADGGSSSQVAAGIIGFCLSVHRGAGGHIITMDVLKQWRRHGVGSALLAEVEERLARAGVDHVDLETATDNAAAIAFWRRHGYRSRGVKRGYYPRGRDAYAMTKSLAVSS